MHENSIFAVLLRSPWWVSALVALAFGGLVRLLVPDVYAAFAALPFIVIAAYSAWQQLRLQTPDRIDRLIDKMSSQVWEDITL